MSEHQDSSPQEAIQISIKKAKNDRVPKEKKKAIKKPLKKKNTESSSKIKKLLQQKIQDQNLLKELERKPLSFGLEQQKTIKIREKTAEKKQLLDLGVSLVYSIKKENRKGVDYLNQIINKSAHLRKDMRNIRNLKNRNDGK